MNRTKKRILHGVITLGGIDFGAAAELNSEPQNIEGMRNGFDSYFF
jgi:hypothetical protein